PGMYRCPSPPTGLGMSSPLAPRAAQSPAEDPFHSLTKAEIAPLATARPSLSRGGSRHRQPEFDDAPSAASSSAASAFVRKENATPRRASPRTFDTAFLETREVGVSPLTPAIRRE